MPRRTWKPSGKHKKLFAGPWVGEFGWELFGWQAKLRWLRRHVYDEVFVQCKPGHEVLYKDFATIGYPTEMSCQQEIVDCDILGAGQLPVNYACNWNEAKCRRLGFFDQEWARLGRKTDTEIDVVIHARKRTWAPDHNWSGGNWVGLVDRLQAQGLVVAQIGLTRQTFNLPCTDFRDRSIENVANLLASSRLCVGTSSGPMHLASLSGCPHLVLSDDTNIMRYMQHWNPFQTECRLAGSWHPPVPLVHARASEMLHE